MRTAQGLLIQSVLLSAPGDCVGFPSRGLVVRGPTWFVSFPSPWGRRLPLVWVLHFRLLQDIQMSEERRGVLRRRCARWGRFQSAGCLAVGRVQVCGRVSDAAGTTGFPLAGRCTEPRLRVLHTRLFHLPSFGRGVLINGLGEVEESWRTPDAGPGRGVRTVDTVLPGRAARVLLRGRLVVVRVLGPPFGLAGSGLLVQQRVEPRGCRWLLGGSHSVGVSSIRPSAVTVRLGVRVFGRRRCRVFRHITALWFLLTGMAASFESEPRDDVEPMLSANLHPWPPSCDGCWFGPLRLCFYRRKPKNRGANFFGWLGMVMGVFMNLLVVHTFREEPSADTGSDRRGIDLGRRPNVVCALVFVVLHVIVRLPAVEGKRGSPCRACLHLALTVLGRSILYRGRRVVPHPFTRVPIPRRCVKPAFVVVVAAFFLWHSATEEVPLALRHVHNHPVVGNVGFMFSLWSLGGCRAFGEPTTPCLGMPRFVQSLGLPVHLVAPAVC
eukprot:m.198481 g.198481  ORF g.198481 m.198481 type:complete len:495 (+) comp25138_c0_seq1:285-1769(+)